jgi:hypothetical protein
MVEVPIDIPWKLVLPEQIYQRLHQHLFPGDHDEHGAVIVAGLTHSRRGVRLLARDVRLAVDGRDYVPGTRGYRKLKADFIRDQILYCRDERLVYLAVHNHAGRDHVAFSSDDMDSHERGYPALRDIAKGMPVGALVFAENAVAGDLWLPDGRRVELAEAQIVGRSLRTLMPAPHRPTLDRDPTYDRQARLFGDSGQALLSQTKIGIIGLGGAGSLLAEYLGRLGVGEFVLVDPDRVEVTNLPRLVAASMIDALAWFGDARRPAWMRRLASRLARPKVLMARRNIRRANPKAKVDAIFGDFLDATNASKFADCDYLFLAADTMRARLLFNAIIHQYLIPGVQVGAKVRVEQQTGKVLDVFSVVRTVTSESGCLMCNGLINAAKLQMESISEADRKAQAYVDEPTVTAPSVITLNAVATAHAANDFLFYITGLRDPAAAIDYNRFHPLNRRTWADEPRHSSDCVECGAGTRSRLARGDGRRLPTIEGSSS